MKKLNIHWFVVIPSLVVLGVVATVMAAVILFAGKEAEKAGGPAAVADRYAADMATLRAEIERSDKSGAVMVQVAMNALLSVRVPRENLDKHLSSVIQLRALEHTAPSADAEIIRQGILEILRLL